MSTGWSCCASAPHTISHQRFPIISYLTVAWAQLPCIKEWGSPQAPLQLGGCAGQPGAVPEDQQLCSAIQCTPHVYMTAVWNCFSLRYLNTSVVTELTISDVWQWSCLLAISFTVVVLCLYFCRYMAKWLPANFAFLSATYCGVQWGNHTGGATSCIKYGLTAEVKHSKFHKTVRPRVTWRKDQRGEGIHLVPLMGHQD